jgi:hypothetical protein
MSSLRQQWYYVPKTDFLTRVEENVELVMGEDVWVLWADTYDLAIQWVEQSKAKGKFDAEI